MQDQVRWPPDLQAREIETDPTPKTPTKATRPTQPIIFLFSYMKKLISTISAFFNDLVL